MRKIIYCMVLVCIMVVLSACSSKSKQEPAANQTSAAVQPAGPVQPSGEVVTAAAQPAQNSQLSGSSQSNPEAAVNNKNDKEEDTESNKSVDQQPGTSVPDNTSQIQPEKVENKAVLPAKVYVFTNNNGCCEATRQKYAEYRKEVEAVESKYGNLVPFTWFDIGIGDVAYQKELQRYAKIFGIKTLPAIVVVDASDNVIVKQAAPLNMAEIDKVFGGMN